MSNVGAMYLEGLGGLSKDDVQAVLFFRRAAEAGNAEGMFNLGSMYEKGLGGLSKDEDLALSWYRKAAQLGSTRAVEVLKKAGVEHTQ